MAVPMPFAIVGAGRLGTAMIAAFRANGVAASGPHGRGYDGSGDAVVLLCVPDDAIAPAAAAIGPGPLVGHCSGVSGLDVIGPREAFSVHPLMTVTRDGADFVGAFAAVSGSTPHAAIAATGLAAALGLRPVRVAEADRGAYHAAAAIAANFLVTLESAAAELMSTAGLGREVLLPLARAALENWGRLGTSALTGPIVRGDHLTVARHREVIGNRTPGLLVLFDALVGATERLAAADGTAAAGIGSAGPIGESPRTAARSQAVAPQSVAPQSVAPQTSESTTS